MIKYSGVEKGEWRKNAQYMMGSLPAAQAYWSIAKGGHSALTKRKALKLSVCLFH